MADEPQGPGWWQASDGAWYPPELHPDAPPPTAPTVPAAPIAPIESPPTFAAPPPVPGPTWDAPPAPPGAAPPSKSRPTALIVAAIVAVIAIVAVGAVVLGSKDDSKTATTKSSSDTSAASDSNGSSDSSDASAATDGVSSSSPDEPTGPTIEAAAAGISITLPDGWTGTSTEDGVDGVGVALFPDDPDLAATFQARATALPRLVLLFGVDAVAARSSPDIVSNLNAAEDASVPSNLSLDAATQAEARGLDAFADVQDQGVVSFPNVDAGRIEYSAKAGQFSGVAYVYKEAGTFWIVTFIFEDLGTDNVAMADASAATFKAG